MILQALKEYYERKLADLDSGIAPAGFEWKTISFVIVLKTDGTPVALSTTFEGTGKEKRAKTFLVPQSVKRTSGIAPNLLWDNPEYALGVVTKGKPDRVKEKHAAFVRRIDDLGELQDDGLTAVRKFLELPDKANILERFGETWREMKDSDESVNVSFSLSGDKGLILERPVVSQAITRASQVTSEDKFGICLISGERQPIERLHKPIKGVRGAQTSGANIVSFNLDAFESYGKKQGDNAPVGKTAAFAYTTALNHLLGSDSRQKLLIGDATVVFWAEKPTNLETEIVDIFGEPPRDDPDRGVKAVKSLFQSIESGGISTDSEHTRFYVLGLAPNASRLSVRLWIVDTVAGMAGKIVQHFRDIAIQHGARERDTLSLFQLLVATATQGKSENIPPNLAGETMRAILSGLPYPQTLLQAAIRRIRAEHNIGYARASLIKGCINRRTRFDNPLIQEELKVNLDTSNTNIGYRLGRLFAVLERIQAEANPGINATIRDRYYGAASGTPVAVFSNLMRLKNHHLAKIESKGRRIFFEKLIAEIVEAFDDFPAHLSLHDQGRFAIGYYHQNQQFFTKKESTLAELNTQTTGEMHHEQS